LLGGEDERHAAAGHDHAGTTASPAGRYPLLKALLAAKGLALQGIYTVRDVAAIFGVSTRTIQDWARQGKLHTRDLPGRGRFLSEDLEQLLQPSRRGGQHGETLQASV